MCFYGRLHITNTHTVALFYLGSSRVLIYTRSMFYRKAALLYMYTVNKVTYLSKMTCQLAWLVRLNVSQNQVNKHAYEF